MEYSVQCASGATSPLQSTVFVNDWIHYSPGVYVVPSDIVPLFCDMSGTAEMPCAGLINDLIEEKCVLVHMMFIPYVSHHLY